MHNGPQLNPTPGQSLLQHLHIPRNSAHHQHPRSHTGSRSPNRLIKPQLSCQSFGKSIIASRPHRPKRPISRKPIKPLSRIAQRVICGETGPLEPQQLTISANDPRHSVQTPLGPPLPSGLPPKLSRIPPKSRRPIPKHQRKIQLRISLIKNNIILRQPVKFPPRADAHTDTLLRRAPIRLVPLGRPRRGNHRMRARADINIDSKLIAARDSPRRMHDHRMTNAISFRIQRPLNPQRPIMQPMLERSPLPIPDKPEFEARAPLRMRAGLRGSESSVIFVKRHANGMRPDGEKQSVPAHIRQRSTALPQDASRIARAVAGTAHTAISARTPSASILAPSPPAMISPRLITQYRSAMSLAKS
ncbi:hypothetical protein BCh11DRAFT_00493 [Burkholderia sp. Ch1-1]|nr:hypothetical protein BCh11DRAFT_00493 [Burkholderia sp. Ch1-1]